MATLLAPLRNMASSRCTRLNLTFVRMFLLARSLSLWTWESRVVLRLPSLLTCPPRRIVVASLLKLASELTKVATPCRALVRLPCRVESPALYLEWPFVRVECVPLNRPTKLSERLVRRPIRL